MPNDSYNSYAALKEKKVDIADVSEWHCLRLLTSIKSQLKLRQKIRNPYSIKVAEPIKHAIFVEIFRAVKEYRKGNGGTEPRVGINTIRDKPGRRGTITNTYILTFTDLFSVLHVFSNLSGVRPVLPFFSKKIKNCYVDVKVSTAKPLIITYKRKKETCIITESFEVKNEFGVVCSF